MIFGRLVEGRGGVSPEPMVRYVADYLDEQFGSERLARTPLTEAEVFPALRKLGLAGRYYEPEDLRKVLQRRLRLELKVVTIDDQLWCKRMLKEGIRGSIRVIESTNRGEIWVPRDLDHEELAGVMYHELAHIVAAHPLPLRPEDEDRPGRVRFWLPERRFTSRRPPFDLAACEHSAALREGLLRWCEADADSWAEHLRTFGAYGPRTYFRERLFLKR